MSAIDDAAADLRTCLQEPEGTRDDVVALNRRAGA